MPVIFFSNLFDSRAMQSIRDKLLFYNSEMSGLEKITKISS